MTDGVTVFRVTAEDLKGLVGMSSLKDADYETWKFLAGVPDEAWERAAAELKNPATEWLVRVRLLLARLNFGTGTVPNEARALLDDMPAEIKEIKAVPT